jgi:hypothetical protein
MSSAGSVHHRQTVVSGRICDPVLKQKFTKKNPKKDTKHIVSFCFFIFIFDNIFASLFFIAALPVFNILYALLLSFLFVRFTFNQIQ